MEKYDSDKLFDRWYHSAESQYLEYIANELAEANRLKRIEIRYGHGTGCSKGQQMNRESNLGDQA